MPLESLTTHLDASPTASLPPVDTWDPPFCGDMALTIAADGRWWHEGTPIGRARLVRLLSRLLRRESDGEHYLVTPVEKLRIQVEDRAFLIADAECRDGVWTLTTHLGDSVALGAQRRLVVSAMPSGAPVPEVAIRFGLSARLNRNVYYRLIDIAEMHATSQGSELGMYSDGVWQPLGWLPEETP
ncbi:hypothetical protein C8E00_101452 [Chromohalobacter marismortui]|uniref:DUF1285 domain-containing protein n=1 Tax=Chromohalobacter marismortui TaxID=42055 RepID=A0A4R7NX09_9GAMM|nr:MULTISPECIES: DUF1285 domain-containing protein [Chromohalobacter]MCI0510364.1 DUF1285 domain-containing protein [Chromohalobacter sp.]MCI0594751.1 DUF1285 domain-containing protein [Chromohalobacter sp.]TDU25060.1 hypothetical protein C8E00_101452 [Chromohalobacter marismortui]